MDVPKTKSFASPLACEVQTKGSRDSKKKREDRKDTQGDMRAIDIVIESMTLMNFC